VTSPNRPQQDPRLVLRDMIAEKIHTSDCGCKDFRPDGTDSDDAYYRRHADAVMELFPDVGVEDWLIATVPGPSGDVEVREQIRRPHMPVTHHRYVLRTEPQPLRGED
jgi:hypothetical protein